MEEFTKKWDSFAERLQLDNDHLDSDDIDMIKSVYHLGAMACFEILAGILSRQDAKAYNDFEQGLIAFAMAIHGRNHSLN